MSTAGASFAEVYVMRKLHKQKLKETESRNASAAHKKSSIGGDCETPDPDASAGGCFFWSRKKIHPNLNRTSDDHSN